MRTRLGRVATVLAIVAAVILAGAIYEARRSSAKAGAQTTSSGLEAAVKATQTPVGLQSPQAWQKREDLLGTDAQARAYAEDFTVPLRSILPLPDPAVFYENPSLASVSLVRGAGATAVWEARYKVLVGSTETTFTTAYFSVSRFGPGLTATETPSAGIDGVHVFADLGHFPTEQRIAFLNYWTANRLNEVSVVARLDQTFPGAPWREDTALRASLRAAGKKAGLEPSNLAYYYLAGSESAGALIGYDAATQTWTRIKYAPPNYAAWYARKNAQAIAAAKAAAEAAAAQAAANAAQPTTKTAQARTTPKTTTSSRKKAKRQTQGTQVAVSPTRQSATTGGTAKTVSSAGKQATTGGAAAAPAEEEVEAGGTIPTTDTPWYNLLVLGAALVLLGAAGLVRYARRRHV